MLKLYTILLICISEVSVAYRILGFFPFPGTSHHNAFAPILFELAKRGHQVVYITPVPPRSSHPNLDVRLIQNFKNKYLESLDLVKLGSASIPMASHMLSSATEVLPQYFFGDPEAQRIIHSTDSFDAVLMESYFAQEPVSALLHKFGCVAIEVSSLGDSAWINELSGLPDNPAYQIDFKTVFTDVLTPMEKIYNFYVTWSTVLVSYYHLWHMQGIMDKYFNYTGWESRPPINKLLSNRSMILVNRHVALDYPYPKAPHVQDVGGINIVPNKPLPKDIQKYMDEAKHGVIYFSLGSNLNTSDIVSGEFGKSFFSVFNKLSQNVLIKWENDPAVQIPQNVKRHKWLPQQDILAHKNCKLFITHGGFMSLTESVYHGIPLLGIPFFGDQSKNLKQVESAGYGIKLDYGNISTNSVSWALQELLTNPRYKEEAMRRSRMMREDSTPAVERAAYWVEYAIKYPNALTPRAAYLSFIELHMIDIALFFIVSTYLFYKLANYMLSLCKQLKQDKKVKTS